MDDIPILGHDENRVFKQFLAHYDAPAYVRRARRVQEAYDLLLDRCRSQRDQWLELCRINVGLLHGQAGDWKVLRPLLTDQEQIQQLRNLFTALQPRLRQEVYPTRSLRVLRRTLIELKESIKIFNGRWHDYIEQLDLSGLNTLRDHYNRYYVLEKECAVRSPRVARQGFQPLEPLTVAEIHRVFPLLPLPELR